MKRIVGLVGILFIMMLHMTASAESIQSGRYTYKVNTDGTATITMFNWDGVNGDLNIPSTIDGHTVTKIGSYAFNYGTVGNGYGNLYLPDTVAVIEEFAFSNTTIRTAYIPANVKEIGRGAFSYCKELSRIVVEPENPYYAAVDGALYNKAEKTLIAYVPSAKIPEGIVKIGDYACAGMTVENSVMEIKTLSEIGSHAFDGAHINVSAIEANGSSRRVHVSMTAGYRTYEGYNAYLIPSNIVSIGERTFYEAVIRVDCDSYGDINLCLYTDSLAEMGEGAFYKCAINAQNGADSYTTLKIGSGVKKIPDNAFTVLKCESDHSIKFEIPASLEKVGEWAFWGMENSGEYVVPNKVIITTANKKALQIGSVGERGLSTVQIEVGISVGSIGELSFSESSMSQVTLIEGATSVARYAFDGATMYRLSIPASLSSLEEGAFRNVQGLTSVDFSKTKIYAVPKEAFSGSEIMSIIFPDSVTEIGAKAFYACRNLQNLTLPSALLKIGDEAFYYSAITSLNLPYSLQAIGKYVFLNCSSLKKLYIPASVKEIGEKPFDQKVITLEVERDSYAAEWASENKVSYTYSDGDDLSWLGEAKGNISSEQSNVQNTYELPDFWDDPQGCFKFLREASVKELCEYFEMCEKMNINFYQIWINACNAYGCDQEKIKKEFDLFSFEVDSSGTYSKSISMIAMGRPRISAREFNSAQDAHDFFEKFEYMGDYGYICGNCLVTVSD